MTTAVRRSVTYAVLAVALAGVVLWVTSPGDRTVLPERVPADAPPPRDTHPGPPPGDIHPGPPPSDTHLWRPVDENAVGPLPDYAPEWSTEGRVLVHTAPAMAAAAGWRVGDRLTLPVPQLGAVYRPLIEEIDDGPGGSRSVLGMVRGDDGHARRFVVTVGPAHVFAYIDTPEGPYELSGGRELGWLLPTSSMMAGFDFSEPDYILPESPEAP